jgi:hypothetical protein
MASYIAAVRVKKELKGIMLGPGNSYYPQFIDNFGNPQRLPAPGIGNRIRGLLGLEQRLSDDYFVPVYVHRMPHGSDKMLFRDSYDGVPFRYLKCTPRS